MTEQVTTARDLLFASDGIKLDAPKKFTVASATLTPLASNNFLEGDPDPSAAVIFQQGSEGNRFFAAIWRCEPSVLRWAPDADVTAYVLEGAADIELESGEMIHVEQGDVIATPKGAWSTWRITAPFKEFVVYGA